MSRKGDCWDNAPTERFFRSLKSERLSDFIFTTRKAAKAQVIDYIGYYNGIRLHSTLRYQSPVVHEKELYLNAA
jgi:transposase InsO family protein